MREKSVVLIVDDDKHIRHIISFLLRKEGYDVIEAKNGVEACELASSKRPDVILLDIMMPVMDGYTACHKIKSQEETKNIPIIMLTALHRSEDIMSAIQSGADDYIAKPFKEEVVVAKIDRLLRPAVKVEQRVVNDRRKDERRKVPLELSWGVRHIYGLAPGFKTRIVDISSEGLAFEMVRCRTCTGYKKGGVHPNCIFARYAEGFPNSQELDFIVSYDAVVVLEVKGKIVHIFQPENELESEVVGIKYLGLSEQDKKEIQELIRSIK